MLSNAGIKLLACIHSRGFSRLIFGGGGRGRGVCVFLEQILCLKSIPNDTNTGILSVLPYTIGTEIRYTR